MTRYQYNQLRERLKNSFVRKKDTQHGYGMLDGVGVWVRQCGIRVKPEHVEIIIAIFGSVPYVYQQQDRTKIINYLHKNRYGTFYKTFNNSLRNCV